MSRSLPDIERRLAFGSVTGSFVSMATAGGVTATTHPWTKVWIQNLTDKTLEFSWDGADNVNLTLPANSGFVSDESANVPSNTNMPVIVASGTTFRVRHIGVAPTLGSAKANGEYIA